MATLPPELWIMILDMVIEEGIIRLDQCDRITFPYNHVFLSPGEYRGWLHGSYCRLRLVCRSFSILLGTRLLCDLHTSSFPFQMSIRALRITAFDGSHEPVFQQLLVDVPRCERLVYLEVSCRLSTSSSQPNLSDLLSAGAGRAFPNVQRLSIWLLSKRFLEREPSFWTRLLRAFPLLVTLAIKVGHGRLHLAGGTGEAVTLERLEILYLGGRIIYSGCYFPRLRHTSVEGFSYQSELDIFQFSPQLECLLIRSYGSAISIDVRPFSRLHVLSFCEERLHNVIPLDYDHPLEHLWLYLVDISRNPTLIDEILKRLPGVSRITMDISAVSIDRRRQRVEEFKRMKLDSFGLALRPIEHGDSPLVVERVAPANKADIVKEGIWKKVWGKMRR